MRTGKDNAETNNQNGIESIKAKNTPSIYSYLTVLAVSVKYPCQYEAATPKKYNPPNMDISINVNKTIRLFIIFINQRQSRCAAFGRQHAFVCEHARFPTL